MVTKRALVFVGLVCLGGACTPLPSLEPLTETSTDTCTVLDIDIGTQLSPTDIEAGNAASDNTGDSATGTADTGTVMPKDTIRTVPDENDTIIVTSFECANGSTRCDEGELVQKCIGGLWSTWDDCGEKGQRCELMQGVASCFDQTGTVDTEGDTTTDTQCSERPDFAECGVVTVPDRSYDICVAGTCVSPGCGDASCNVPGPHFPLADTNQRLCYDDGGPMTCASLPCNADSSPDFCGQDAQYGWDVTHNESARFTRTAPAADQPIVQDNVTGLVWQGCAAGLSGSTCAPGSADDYTWSQSLAYCDSLDWGGHTDWRLPDPYELSSIVDSGRYGPTIDIGPAAFTGTPSAVFWSSSSYMHDSNAAWYVDFDGGYLNFDVKYYVYRVRCVRSGPFESRRFESLTLFGDRVVRDNVNQLEWQGCSAGLSGEKCATGSAASYNWKQALSYCEGLSYGDQVDWRLPNRVELQSIVDQRRYGPSIDAVAFSGTPNVWFWSSSSLANFSSYAWSVLFNNGSVKYSGKSYVNRVRCVRSSRGPMAKRRSTLFGGGQSGPLSYTKDIPSIMTTKARPQVPALTTAIRGIER